MTSLPFVGVTSEVEEDREMICSAFSTQSSRRELERQRCDSVTHASARLYQKVPGSKLAASKSVKRCTFIDPKRVLLCMYRDSQLLWYTLRSGYFIL